MKKILLAVLMILCFAIPVMATDVVLPTEEDVVQLFPNAAKVDGVGTYLFIAKSVAIGPSYTIVKFYNLINGDIQFATITKGGSYFGGGLSAEFVDIIKKLGRNPADLIVAFNPSIGITGGYRTSVGAIKAGFDGGIRAKILNVDTDKLIKWIGL